MTCPPSRYPIACASVLLLVIGSAHVLAQAPEAAAPPANAPAANAPAAAPAVEHPWVIPAVDEPFRGKLVAAVEQPPWQLRFDAADGPHEMPVEKLAVWGAFVRPSAGVHVILATGGLIVANGVAIVEDDLVVNSSLAGNIAVPLRLVAGIVFEPSADRARYDRTLDRVLSLTSQVDRVILDNGDELTGTVSSIERATLHLKSDAGDWNLEQAKLRAVLFNSILIDRPSPTGLRIVVGWQDGSRTTAVSLVSQGNNAQLKLVGGVDVPLPLESIVAVQPLGGAVVYLSDLKPASYRHIPFLELSWPFETDRSVQGALLMVDGKLYLKGLGMHSPSRITFELDQVYQRFDAEVAIDAEAGRRGSVVFRVFADDGSGKWQERAKSEIVRGGEPPVRLSADVAARGASACWWILPTAATSATTPIGSMPGW